MGQLQPGIHWAKQTCPHKSFFLYTLLSHTTIPFLLPQPIPFLFSDLPQHWMTVRLEDVGNLCLLCWLCDSDLWPLPSRTNLQPPTASQDSQAHFCSVRHHQHNSATWEEALTRLSEYVHFIPFILPNQAEVLTQWRACVSADKELLQYSRTN